MCRSGVSSLEPIKKDGEWGDDPQSQKLVSLCVSPLFVGNRAMTFIRFLRVVILVCLKTNDFLSNLFIRKSEVQRHYITFFNTQMTSPGYTALYW